MDYFTYLLARTLIVLITLLSMGGGGGGQRAVRMNQKYLNLCSEINEGLTGLEQHEGEYLIT